MTEQAARDHFKRGIVVAAGITCKPSRPAPGAKALSTPFGWNVNTAKTLKADKQSILRGQFCRIGSAVL